MEECRSLRQSKATSNVAVTFLNVLKEMLTRGEDNGFTRSHVFTHFSHIFHIF